MHEHEAPKQVCEHKYLLCQKCDVVYCESCKGEWKRVMKTAHEVLKAMEKQLEQEPLKNPYEYPYEKPQPYWNGKKSAQCH